MDTPPRFLPPDFPDLSAPPPPPGPPAGRAPTPAPRSPAGPDGNRQRLRAITAGVAVLGVAATAGFGLVAAGSTPDPSGTGAASDVETPAATASPGIVSGQPGFDDDDAGVPGFTRPRTRPSRRGLPPGAGIPAPGGTTVEPPAGATGPGDATTGGS